MPLHREGVELREVWFISTPGVNGALGRHLVSCKDLFEREATR